MIDSKELMIGNYFLYENNIYSVKGIDEDGYIITDEYHILADTESTQPIPLTPKILSKIEGFKENRIEIAQNRWLYYGYDDNWEIENYDGETMLELKIPSLHNLQNIYYSLTQKEITINNL